MTVLLLGAAWGALAVLAAVPHRPPPRRVRQLVAMGSGPARPHGADPVAPGLRAARTGALRPSLPHEPSDASPAGAEGTGPRAGPLAAVGRVLLRCTARRASPPPAPADARVVGATAVAVVVALAAAPPLAPLAGLAGWAVPRWRAHAAERHRLERLAAGVPEAVDLLVLAVGAGGNVPLALAAAGRRGSGPLAAELRRISAEVARGRRLADALDELPATAGEPTRTLAAVLATSERYGTPVLPALQRLADEVRLQRQRRAEAAARKVPVALLFPLVLCVLPAFALLTVAPLVAGALRELRL